MLSYLRSSGSERLIRLPLRSRRSQVPRACPPRAQARDRVQGLSDPARRVGGKGQRRVSAQWRDHKVGGIGQVEIGHASGPPGRRAGRAHARGDRALPHPVYFAPLCCRPEGAPIGAQIKDIVRTTCAAGTSTEPAADHADRRECASASAEEIQSPRHIGRRLRRVEGRKGECRNGLGRIAYQAGGAYRHVAKPRARCRGSDRVSA